MALTNGACMLGKILQKTENGLDVTVFDGVIETGTAAERCQLAAAS